MIFYTDWVRNGFAGMTIGPFIFIRPKYKNDIGLHEHEKVHVKQFWRTLGCFPFVYLLSATWRYRWEIEAYAKQLHYCKNTDSSAERFAEFITTRYRLRITQEQVLRDLARESGFFIG